MNNILKTVGLSMGLVVLTVSSLVCTLYQPYYDTIDRSTKIEPFVQEREIIIFEVSLFVFTITAIILISVWLRTLYKQMYKEE